MTTFKSFYTLDTLGPPIVRLVPLDFITSINITVSGTFDYSLDGGGSFTSASGSSVAITGVPSGDVFLTAPSGSITKVALESNDNWSSVSMNEPTGTFTSANAMFRNCPSITSYDFSNWNTANITDFSSMFTALSFTAVDVSNFDTSSATGFSSMFTNCPNLQTLNLGGFDSSQVTAMNSMFDGCTSLSSLNLGAWDTSSCTIYDFMFRDCSLITEIPPVFVWGAAGSRFVSMYQNCTSLICIGGVDTRSHSGTTDMFLNTPSLQRPTSVDITDILAGLQYINPNPCP